MNFETYPFEKLTQLLEDITPNKSYKPYSLTIGEPQFETPDFIQKELKDSSSLLKKYPKTAGEIELQNSMLNFIKNRFDIQLQSDELVSTFGTREVLFNFPQFYLFDKKNPKMGFTNPFYQIYEGSAIASRAKIFHLNLTEENRFKPDINNQDLKDCNLVILNFPNNPTSSTLDLDELKIWVKLALKYNFLLINDECYSEIYFDKKPPSLLEASIAVGNKDFKNILILNSISKRSNAPGLRSGFIAGDKNILKDYRRYRTYVGCAVPIPLQKSATIAWSDENHVEKSRKIYQQNFLLAKEILNIEIPNATFYIWLKVKNDLEFTKELYKNYNIKVLPGSFLGRNGIGKGYVRIALVEKPEIIKEILNILKLFIDEFH